MKYTISFLLLMFLSYGSISQVSDKVTCKTIKTLNPYGVDPILIKTCYYGAYKTISKGYPDYKGNYSWKYFLFKKQANGKYIPIRNKEMFQNQSKLMAIINSQAKKHYDKYSSDPEIYVCFSRFEFTPFTLDQVGVDFNNNRINFYVSFELGGACMCVDTVRISLTLNEIKKYLKG